MENVDDKVKVEIEFSYMYVLYGLLKELDKGIKEKDEDLTELLEKKFNDIIVK